MELEKVSGDRCSIVLIGSFDPMIFQPFWFSQNSLIQYTEAESATIDLITKDVTLFRLKWLTIQVTRDRFLAMTDDESHFLPLRDFVVGTFQLLESTPIKQMGINREIQYEIASEETWHKIGHVLAPKKLWNEHLKNPGMKSLVISGKRDDKYIGEINVTVRPVLEKKILEKKNVVEVSYNSHFNFDKDSALKDIFGIIEETFEATLNKAQILSNSLIKACIEEKE